MQSDDDFLFEAVKNKHKDAFACTEKINDYVKRKFDYELTNDEKLYLTVHIERVVNR
jgi:beta-glucoside operon transcriptional antiterminator